MKTARKQVQQTRTQAKFDRRLKKRLVRKANALNVDDLERIAVLKRCALLTKPQAPSAGPSAAASHGSASRAGVPGSDRKSVPIDRFPPGWVSFQPPKSQQTLVKRVLLNQKTTPREQWEQFGLFLKKLFLGFRVELSQKQERGNSRNSVSINIS